MNVGGAASLAPIKRTSPYPTLMALDASSREYCVVRRDHHPRAFTMWLAGGGIKSGGTIGRTDDLGYDIVDDPVMSTICTPRCCICLATITPG